LLFNPHITVNQNNDEVIDAGDIRLLTVLDTWLPLPFYFEELSLSPLRNRC